MDDFRRFPSGETRQIIDYNRFVALTGTKVFICLDKGVLEIAKYLLNTRGFWRSTYVKQYVGTIGYNMPTVEEFQAIQSAIAEANLDMASCDDIVEAINGITAAVTASSSSGGGSGCGCIGSGDDSLGSVSDYPNATIPPHSEWEDLGFASQEAYESHSCNAAQYILQNYIATLRNWAGLFGTVGGLTIAVVAGLLLLTVPPVGLMLIVAALGLLVGTDIGVLINLSTIADTLEEQIDDLRCQLYNAADTDAAAAVIRDAAAAAVMDLSLGALESTFVTITDNLISNEQLSILFSPIADTGGVTGADCTACAAEWVFVGGVYGSGNTNANPMILDAVDVDGRWRLYVCREVGTENITLDDITGYTPSPSTGGANDASYVDNNNCSGTVVGNLYSNDAPWTGSTYAAAFSGFNSTTPFTVTISKS
jgi:hypothetical protein